MIQTPQSSSYTHLKQLQTYYQLPLSQLLQLNKNNSKNILAIALAKSTTQIMTPQIYSLIIQRINTQPDNIGSWLQVVRRMAKFQYSQAYNCQQMEYMLLQPIIAQFFALSYQQQLQNNHHNRLHQQIISMLHSSHIQTSILAYYINQSIDYYNSIITIDNHNHNHNHNINSNSMNSNIINHSIVILLKIFTIIKSQPKLLTQLLQYINPRIHISTTQQPKQRWTNHYQSVQLMRAVVRLVQTVQLISVKCLKVRQFREDIKQYRWNILPQYIRNVVCLLQNIRILNNHNNNNNNNNNGKHHNVSIDLNIIQTQPINKLISYFIIIVQTIQIISQVSSLQHLLFQSDIKNNILQVMCTSSIINLNNYSDLTTQLLAINQQITTQCYSDTLAGCFIKMIVKLCINVGQYFSIYYQKISQIVRTTDFSHLCNNNNNNSNTNNSNSMVQFVDFILRLTTLSNTTILKQREQQLQKLVNNITDTFLNNMQYYNQFQQIQILRFILAFVGKIDHKNNNNNNNNNNSYSRIGVSQSAQELVIKCVGMCFQCLFPSNNSMQQMQQQIQYSTSISQLTPLQKQCQNILLTLPQSGNIISVLSHNIPIILQYFLSHARPSIILLQILQNFIIKIPQIVQRSTVDLLEFYYRIWDQQIHQIQWRKQNGRNNRIGYGAKIGKILSGYTTILQQASQISHQDIQQKVVNPVLSKLCIKNFLPQYHSQLLQILTIVLQKHSSLTPQLLLIFSKLPQIYAQNSNKLPIFIKLYFILSTTKHLTSQILYDHHETILTILINLIADYFDMQLTPQQYCFYVESVKEIIMVVIVFINCYQDAITTNQYMKQNICQTVIKGIQRCFKQCSKFMQHYITYNNSTISDNNSIMQPYRQFQQLLLQLSITISHTLISPNLSLQYPQLFPTILSMISSIDMHKLSYIQTAKMIPIFIIDQLFLSNTVNHQQIINDLLRYLIWMREFSIQNGIKKQWKFIKYTQYWTGFNVDNQKVKDYVLSALRHIKNQKIIQQIDYLEYVNKIQQLMR